MIRHPFLAAPLALALLSTYAQAAGKTPPPEYAAYVAAVRKADAIKDDLQRCLAYPDLPGNTWTPGVAKTRCTMFLTKPELTLDAIEQALAQPDGANAVDGKFRALLDAHFQKPAQREQIFIALSIFKDDARADDAERIARAWRKAAPDSPFAQTALGHVLANRGWNARGSKFLQDTPADNVRLMDQFFGDAVAQYLPALKAEPKLLPACVALMEIGRQSADVLENNATAECLKVDPASYYVVDEWSTASEPRWGGSLEKMRYVAAYAKAHEQENPALALIAFNYLGYEIERADNDEQDRRAIAELAPAALQVPNAAFLRSVGGAWLRKDEYWKAFVYLSQALRFMPGYAQESRWRAMVLDQLDEPEWARADAERAVALEPDNGYAQQQLGGILLETGHSAEAVPHFREALKDSKTRQGAYTYLCGTLIDTKQRDAAGKCVDDLLAEYPENPEGWRQRVALIGYDAPGSVDAMERFLALNDPKRWPYHAKAAETMRKILASKQGTASAADLFDARVARAKAIEHTEEGRAYLKRMDPSTSSALSQSLTSCAALQPKDQKLQITAVLDVHADGRVADVVIHPDSGWTTCIAKRFQAALKPPPLPEAYAPSGFPMLLEIRVR